MHLLYWITTWTDYVHLVLLAISVAATIGSLWSCIRSRSRRRGPTVSGGPLYEDANGASTQESQKQYQRISRWLFLIMIVIDLLGSIHALIYGVGLVIGMGLADDESQRRSFYALFDAFLMWTCILIQTISAMLTPDPVKRHEGAILEALTAAAVCGTFFLEFAPLPGGPTDRGFEYLSGTETQAVLNSGLAVLIILTSLSFPRTPQLYRDGRPLDGALSVSVINWSTYAWPGQYLKRAWVSKQLDFSDLDILDAGNRARELFESIQKTSSTCKGSLIKQIFVNNRLAFAAQYTVTIIDGVCIILPQMTMYNLLLALERKDRDEDVSQTLWFWVFGLGAAIVIQGIVNNSMWFIGYCRINIPVRIQLAAMIFEKSMRKKFVQGAATQDKKDAVATSSGSVISSTDEEDTLKPSDEQDELQKMRQGVINLVGVDADRIGMFGTHNNLFLSTAVRLGVGFTFLGTLLGWQALLAGLSTQMFFLPLNIYFSKRYSSAQDKLMKVRDRKLAVLNEALNGIRQIKFSALENRWQEKVGTVREEELNSQWRVFLADTLLITCWIFGPVLLSAASISVYAVVHGHLPPSIAFTTIAILTELETTLSAVPELSTHFIDAWISFGRIQAYLSTPDRQQITAPDSVIRFEGATLAWPSDEDVTDEAFKLHGVTLDFPNGELSVISGRTGSGKSLLLAAILGEAELLNGTLRVPKAPSLEERFDSRANVSNWLIPSAIAYVSQQPWIENRTFRDNVLFDLPFNADRYRDVLYACSLQQDLKTLSDGDMTEIGANGINLSGGQRWRVTLARALYSRAGILVMDDIFSAVDAHVGRHIFENALTGKLAEGRTRILVTHHVALCIPATKYEVRLANGKVEHAGILDDLRRQDILDKIIEEEPDKADADEGAVIDDETEQYTAQLTQVLSRDEQPSITAGGETTAGLVRKRTFSSTVRRMSRSSNTSGNFQDPRLNETPRKFVEEEAREQGRVKFSVYSAYVYASGGFSYWLLILLVFATYQTIYVARSWVLRLWTENDSQEAISHVGHATFFKQGAQSFFDNLGALDDAIDSNMKFYLILYVALAIIMCLAGTFRYLLVCLGSIKASRVLFDKMIFAVLRAPLRWLDTVPVGRVLNRFTGDFNKVDSNLAVGLTLLLYYGLIVIGTAVAAAIVSPYIILIAMVLFSISTYFATYFLAGAREAKRLESTAKSPIFDFFSAALQGITTVRAFSKKESYIDQMFQKLNTHAEAMWFMCIANRWLAWRLSIVGACFAVVTASLVVSFANVDAALGGFALSFTLNFQDAIEWLLRYYSMVELAMNSTERVIEYAQIATEDQGGVDAPAVWPTNGRVEVNDLVVGYAADLPPVLKGLTFSVKPNERVGVVGRTGAGKSSLTLALFRFLEAREGSIFIDGVDVSKIKLHDLRSRLSIIAQDPVLFSGTIRSNLDPFNEHADHELREALERVHLVSTSSAASTAVAEASSGADGSSTPVNINPFESLSSSVSEGGQNLSQGQRQLLCLARAIVARPKVLVLDEATSAVDKATDALIQRSIREEFKNSTLIVIAHRLSTIADFDRILVMSDGKVAEFGTPKELMEVKGEGVFRAMVDDSGERDVLREVILG